MPSWNCYICCFFFKKLANWAYIEELIFSIILIHIVSGRQRESWQYFIYAWWMSGWPGPDRSMDGWIDGQMDGWIDGQMDGWMDGWIEKLDGWMGSQYEWLHMYNQ